jgi:S-adenosylmethionine decarboxylase proenzyme
MRALGRHLLVEFYDCNPDIINNKELVEQYMKEAALKAGSTIVQSVFHMFQPHGVSGVVVIAESHLAIHTWPEYKYASVDLYTCGSCVDPLIAYRYLKNKFESNNADLKEITRGELENILPYASYKPEKCTYKQAVNDDTQRRGVVL